MTLVMAGFVPSRSVNCEEAKRRILLGQDEIQLPRP